MRGITVNGDGSVAIGALTTYQDLLDSQELTADRQAAEAMLASLRYQVSQTRATEEQTAGEGCRGAACLLAHSRDQSDGNEAL